MDPITIGLGAAKIAGGLFGAKKADKRHEFERQRADDIRVIDRTSYLQDTQRARDWALQDAAQVKADMSTQFIRLREAAEMAGLNPLTVLGSPMVPGAAGGLSAPSMGGGDTFVGGQAPLSSTQILLEGFAEVGQAFTGQAALDRAEQTARTKLMKVEAERLGGGGISGVARAGVATVRAKPSVTGTPAKGAPKIDSYGYALDKAGSPMMPDRATDINRTQNEPWFKEMRVGGRDFKVYNDEASESEIASTASLATLPWQWAYQMVTERIATRQAWAAEDRLKAGVSGPVRMTTPGLAFPSTPPRGNNFNPSAFPQLYK